MILKLTFLLKNPNVWLDLDSYDYIETCLSYIKVYCGELYRIPLQSQVKLDLFVYFRQHFMLSHATMILIEFHKTCTYGSHVV